MSELDVKLKTYLKSLYGDNAKFRDGQLEAIKATIQNKRTLIVQKTGWGKSLVYFLCTKILKENRAGVCIVVSPLLVLMEDQMDAAKKLGLKCDVLNSNTTDRHQEIIKQMQNNSLDLVLVTPETLFKTNIQDALVNININLFVIDEVHCISDWGHDFRLKYSNLYKVINSMPSYIPVLGTTATATERVVNDLKKQLGDNVFVLRGSLERESLAINIINLKTIEERYAWIVKNINKLPGVGIIYCLTQNDCDYLCKYLNKHNITAKIYYSVGKDKDKEKVNTENLSLFSENKIKVLVATVKLGMGYDKGDIGFVIHYQMPSNIVAYYQQIGRAGRNIVNAEIILMHGSEDKEIINYFINNAFPTREHCELIYNNIHNQSSKSIEQIINVKHKDIMKTIDFLVNEDAIYKEGSKYYKTLNNYEYNEQHYKNIQNLRNKEFKQIEELVKTDSCISQYILNCLDDYSTNKCNKCSNCTKINKYDNPSLNDINDALEYRKSLIIPIEPRKQWAITQYTKKVKIPHQNQTGICLCRYGNAGYGKLVRDGKINSYFNDELVNKSAEILAKKIREEGYKHLTCVPSLRSDIVRNFAQRLATKLNITFIDLLEKDPNNQDQQKLKQNSSHQCANALSSFYIKNQFNVPDKIILVDDMVDSKWTLTVCGNLLGEHGATLVLPYALADTSNKEDYNEE